MYYFLYIIMLQIYKLFSAIQYNLAFSARICTQCKMICTTCKFSHFLQDFVYTFFRTLSYAKLRNASERDGVIKTHLPDWGFVYFYYLCSTTN